MICVTFNRRDFESEIRARDTTPLRRIATIIRSSGSRAPAIVCVRFHCARPPRNFLHSRAEEFASAAH